MLGDKLNLDGIVYECVFETKYDNKDIVILHPIDAPKGMMFVIMHHTSDNGLLPIDNQFIGECVLNLYEQKIGLNTSQIAKDYMEQL